MTAQSTSSSFEDPDISVYGYDPALRQAINRTNDPDTIFKPHPPPSPPPNNNPKSTLHDDVDPNKPSPLLSLPFEIRSTILHLLLPHTIPSPPSSNLGIPSHHPRHRNKTIWQRGQTSLLTLNHQFYSECTEILYGSTNTFLVLVDRGIFFRFERLVPHNGGLVGRQSIALSRLPRSAVARIRRWHLLIPHVDSYSGEVFYGKSNRAAIDDHLRGYVRTFAEVVAGAETEAEEGRCPIVRVDVELGDGTCSYLEPLKELEGRGLVRLEMMDPVDWCRTRR